MTYYVVLMRSVRGVPTTGRRDVPVEADSDEEAHRKAVQIYAKEEGVNPSNVYFVGLYRGA